MKVYLSQDLFGYDIQALVCTFRPGMEVSVAVSGNLRQLEEARDFPEGALLLEFGEAGERGRISAALYMDGADALREAGETTPKERRAYKNQVKRVVYRLLSRHFGKTPAWGTLTGVRPTKLPMECLDLGWEDADILAYLKKEYLASEEKLSLALEIAKNEKRLLEKIDVDQGYSLYVGIPFCPTTCHYCSFASFSMERWAGMVPAYLEALHREIEDTAGLMKGKRLTCVYFGGGTPTALSAEQLRDLILHVKAVFPFEGVQEFTVEAGRPDTITEEKLGMLLDCGVERISINPQTMQQQTLDRVGRNHSVEQVASSMQLARAMGFDNINMDLILGLPGEGLLEVEDTLKKIRALAPDSLTVHSMVLKRAAKLNLTMSVEETADGADMEAMTGLGMAYARSMGLAPYYMYRQKNAKGSRSPSRDNIGYAKPGKEGLYNMIIMEELQSILALGAGATTKLTDRKAGRIERADNVKSLRDYIERIDEMTERKKKLLQETPMPHSGTTADKSGGFL